MGPRVFHAKFQPDRPKGVGLTTSGGQQLLGEQGAQKSIKRAAPSSENWKSVIKQNVLVRPGLRKKMLRKSQFFTN